MQIASAKSRSAKGTSHQTAFMGSCLLVTCDYPVYLIDELALMFLVLLKEMRILHRCKPRIAKGVVASPQTFHEQGGER